METYQAVILGILQGLTEFLPVSSSGHLALTQHLFGITTPTLFFDICLHIGTLIAVVIVFFDSIKAMVLSIINLLHSLIKFNLDNVQKQIQNNTDIRLAFLIIVGSIPTALLGFFIKQYVVNLFGSINFVGTMLIITGTFLWFTRGFNNKTEADMKAGGDIMNFGYGQALFIGLCQGIAVLPGISRSGATIASGLFVGINRETAAKFSFLLSIPAILGAEALGLKDFMNGHAGSIDISILYGTIMAFVTGYIALKALLKIVKTGKLHLFAPYCWILGVIAVIGGVL
ncbi:MAG: undecaprenyl-diphosphate phosphatase [Desulfamplus sp.]|nr:undecaprenyl-diphosphate phosphatase [Desulfamplus sp.]